VYLGGVSSSAPTIAAVASLAEIQRAVGSWCEATDPALLSGADAAAAAEQLAGLVRRLSTTQATLAARAAECRAFSRRFASGEAWLAGLNGTSQTQAKRALDTVKRLADCPTAKAAFEAGQLSVDEADMVTAAAVVNPAAESRLVDRALQHVHADTRSAADRARHAVFSREQEQARLARQRRLRRVRELTDADQLAWVDSHLVPEAWAMVRPVLDAYTDIEFQTARRAGRRESLDAYRADGLIAALRAAGTCLGTPPPHRSPDSEGDGGPPPLPRTGEVERPPLPLRHDDDVAVGAGAIDGVADLDPRPPRGASASLTDRKVVVLVDAIALARGFATDTETCEIAGPGTRVPVEWVEQVMADAAVDVLVHDRVDIRAHALVRHRSRRRAGPEPPTGDPVCPTVVVLVDGPALASAGEADEGRAIPVPGSDLRLSVAALRRLTTPPIADALEHGLIALDAYRTHTRHKRRPIRLALLARDRRCSVPQCATRGHLEHDHVHDYAEGGPTDALNLHGDCRPHHRHKTLGLAHMEITDTERLWWPLSTTDPTTDSDVDPTPVPWRAPLGEHLNAWDLTQLPHDHPDEADDSDQTDDPDGTLPFG